jgi:hypothetical protein
MPLLKSPIDAFELARLEHELSVWRRAWRFPRLWWRDDDARAPGPALDRLLALRGDLPLTLAIIPDGDLEGLARRLADAPGVSPAQHGVDHVNRLPAGGRRSEFAANATVADVAAEIDAARRRMAEAGLAPAMFVPPWNEADDRLLVAVAAAGHAWWSGGAGGAPTAQLAHVGAEVDVLRWKGRPRFRGAARIFRALRRQLELRRAAGWDDRPTGLLTHHLALDEPAWSFLESFLPAASRLFVWADAAELVRPSAAARETGPAAREAVRRRALA